MGEFDSIYTDEMFTEWDCVRGCDAVSCMVLFVPYCKLCKPNLEASTLIDTLQRNSDTPYYSLHLVCKG